MQELIGDRYRLVRRLGAGGMAEVWEATDVRTGTTVAVKRLHPRLASDAAARTRFRREIEAARSIAHPAAVRTLDADPDADDPWLAMEYVPGGSLAERLAGGAAVPEDEAAPMGADVADALAALHAAGIVHRDVTPSNILLAPDGARLADFGIARESSAEVEDLTATGDLVGTFRFLAPEVLAGEPASPASDVWSLGAVLYEALGGAPPFDVSSPAALLESQRVAPTPLQTDDAALGALVARMLDPDARTRPAAGDAAHALRAIAPLGDPSTDHTAVIPVPVVGAAPAATSPAIAPAARRLASPDIVPARSAAPAPPAQPRRSGADRSRAALLAGALLAGAVLVAVAASGGADTGRASEATATPGDPAATEPARTPDATPDATPPPTAAPAVAPRDGGKPPKDDGKGKGKGKDDGKGNGKGKGHGG